MNQSPSATPSISPTSWPVPQEVTPDVEGPTVAVRENVEKSANWFFWIAALSIVNSLIVLSGASWTFIFGLVFTQFVDVLIGQFKLTGVAATVCIVINATAIVIFCGLGYFARRCQIWAFIVGLILYLMDALLALLIGDFMLLAFHAFVIFKLSGGIVALRSNR